MSRSIASGFLALVSVMACAGPGVAPAGAVVTATEFVRLYAAGRLTGDDAKRLLGSGAIVAREGAYWQARSANRVITILIRAEQLNESSDDAELRLALEANLTLADLQRSFGTWRPVSTGESSSVAFRVSEHRDRPVLVFVRLFTSEPRADSVVLSIQPRLEKATK